MKTISYGICDDGLVVARCNDQIAFPVLDFAAMTPENKFKETYKIESEIVFRFPLRVWKTIKWTKNIPIETKNLFREHFKFPLLKG